MSAPAFNGLGQTAFGVLGSWSDGRIVVLENTSEHTADGGVIGFRFREIARATPTPLTQAAIPIADLPASPRTP